MARYVEQSGISSSFVPIDMTNESVERLLLDDEAWLLSNSALMSSIIPPQSIKLPLLILSAQSLEQIHQILILEPLIKLAAICLTHHLLTTSGHIGRED